VGSANIRGLGRNKKPRAGTEKSASKKEKPKSRGAAPVGDKAADDGGGKRQIAWASPQGIQSTAKNWGGGRQRISVRKRQNIEKFGVVFSRGKRRSACFCNHPTRGENHRKTK